MNIYLVRHGETEWNREEVFRGKRDVLLSERGLRQAEQTGRYFSGRDVERILSSPMRRAVQTAEEIGKAAGGEIEIADGLTDMGFGAWEGMSLAEVERLYPGNLDLWRRAPQRLNLEDGERLGAVSRRAVQAVREALTGEGGLVIVTHRVVCKLMALHFLRIGLSHFWDMKFDPCSITLLETKGATATLVYLNETCHLRADVPARGYRDF
jgi:phosphoserine phosphatase